MPGHGAGPCWATGAGPAAYAHAFGVAMIAVVAALAAAAVLALG